MNFHDNTCWRISSNYHDAGRKDFKKQPGPRQKTKETIRSPSCRDLAWVLIKIFFLYLSFQTKQLRDHFHSAPEKGLKIFSHLPGGSIK